MRVVYCQKLKKEAEGLTKQPYLGPLGQKIFDHISKEAWKQWLEHQTLLINENRLNLLDESARLFLEQEMEKFLFSGSSEKPAGYRPTDA